MFDPGQISFPLYVYAGPINRRSTLSLSPSLSLTLGCLFEIENFPKGVVHLFGS